MADWLRRISLAASESPIDGIALPFAGTSCASPALYPHSLVNVALNDHDMSCSVMRISCPGWLAVLQDDAHPLGATAVLAAQPILQIPDQHVGEHALRLALQLASRKPADMAATALDRQHRRAASCRKASACAGRRRGHENRIRTLPEAAQASYHPAAGRPHIAARPAAAKIEPHHAISRQTERGAVSWAFVDCFRFHQVAPKTARRKDGLRRAQVAGCARYL